MKIKNIDEFRELLQNAFNKRALERVIWLGGSTFIRASDVSHSQPIVIPNPGGKH